MKHRPLLLLAFLPGLTLCSQVTLPKILASHMVIQRDLPVHVWGMGTPGASVSVSFRGESRSTSVDNLGRWSLYLPPGAAGGPFQMTIRSADSGSPIVLDDVLAGDVWVASGQSNMEFAMHQAATAKQDLPDADNPRMRLLIVKKNAADFPQSDIDTTGWNASTPESARDFSAVAWYFAREIEQREHVPVGVIDSTWGGTVAEAWTRLTAMGEDSALNPLFASRGRMMEQLPTDMLEAKRLAREQAEARAAGRPVPETPWRPDPASWGPGNLWNGMIAPLTPFAIRGVIWYQGESNSKLDRAPLYGRIFRTLIEDWRRGWGIGAFPFLFVQISNYKSDETEDWATLREQQVKTLAIRNTAMAVTIDIGNPDDVHPTDKVDVGLRLARAARALSYGESIEYSGPMFREATPEGSELRIWLDHAKGLNARGGEVTGFEVAGKDGKFVSATAKIEGETIVVSSPSVVEPVEARYGWANSPQCNLFNGEGLPASPFRTAPNER
jgi:sialate O-acetylesterase